MTEQFEHLRDDEKRARSEWVRRKLLEAALEGKGIHMQLMIGDEPVENGVTFEGARFEFFELMDVGYIELDSSYKPKVTERGKAALSRLTPEATLGTG